MRLLFRAGAALAVIALVFSVPTALAVPRGHHPRGHHPRGRGHRHAAPWRVRIPAIGVDARIIPLGVNRNGTVAVPPLVDVQDVGWYKYGAVPGQPGPAIFLGHVDSYTGPAAFYRLYLIARGDHVYVHAGGRSVTYAVSSLRQVSKQAFPSSIYNPAGPPKLYLITCAGDFDYVTRHYDDNIIITARLLTPPRHRPTPKGHKTRHTGRGR